jgi:hypothetical protein
MVGDEEIENENEQKGSKYAEEPSGSLQSL